MWYSFSGESYKYNMASPLPAQRNLTPPPSFYPQQPVSVFSDNIPNNRNYQRIYSSTSGGLSDIGSASTRTNRADINVWSIVVGNLQKNPRRNMGYFWSKNQHRIFITKYQVLVFAPCNVLFLCQWLSTLSR